MCTLQIQFLRKRIKNDKYKEKTRVNSRETRAQAYESKNEETFKGAQISIIVEEVSCWRHLAYFCRLVLEVSQCDELRWKYFPPQSRFQKSAGKFLNGTKARVFTAVMSTVYIQFFACMFHSLLSKVCALELTTLIHIPHSNAIRTVSMFFFSASFSSSLLVQEFPNSLKYSNTRPKPAYQLKYYDISSLLLLIKDLSKPYLA